MRSEVAQKKSKGLGVGTRRVISYIVLVILSFLCLFWFYILFINSTRSNGELTKGFTLLPSTHFLENWTNVMKGSQPVVSGMINSCIIAICSAILCTYFSTMPAYAIQEYNFKLKKIIATFN